MQTDGRNSRLRDYYGKKRNLHQNINEVAGNGHDLVETDTELFITERVNNLLFRKNGPMV